MKVAAASFVAFILGMAACYLLLSVGGIPKLSGIPTVSNDLPQTVSIYLSFVGVMLTAVTVVIAAVTIGIGVIAAYTFSGLKTEARSSAQGTAKEVSESTAKAIAADALSEVKIKGIVEAYLAVYVRQKEQESEWGPQPDDEER